MRTFWILILLLAAGAAGWLALAPDTVPAPRTDRPKPDTILPAPAPELDEPTPPNAEGPSPDASAASAEPSAETPAAEAPEAEALTYAAPEPAEEPDAPAEAVEPVETVDATPADAPEAAPASEPASPAVSTPDAAVASGGAPRDETDAGTLKPAEIVEQEDGSLLVDGRFVVKGEGTPEKPYQVTWDMLVSAGEVYQPRQGRTELPGRITMLAGKHVQITGNIAFPLMAEEAGELLAMLNQWDGCCIGVPPTPYDAIEVQLREPVTGPDRLATYGTVTGRFDVKPHLVGNWLVGLYVMEDATLATKSFGGFSP